MAVATVKMPRAHPDELREVFVQRAEAPVHPSADGRHTRIKHVPAGMKLHLRTVIVIGGPHRADHRNVIDTAADVWEPITHLDAALAVLFVADLQRIQLVALLAVGIVHHHHAHLLQPITILHILKLRLVDRFAGQLIEHRLRIKTLHVAHATAHEEPNHTLRLGRKMWQAVHTTIPTAQHRAQRQTTKAQSGAAQKHSAVEIHHLAD